MIRRNIGGEGCVWKMYISSVLGVYSTILNTDDFQSSALYMPDFEMSPSEHFEADAILLFPRLI